MLRVILYMLCFTGFSQTIVKGKIYNKENYEAIPYVNVGILHTTIGDISDLKGNFTLIIPDSLSNDNLTIHSPGFEKLQISIYQLLDNEARIFLKPSFITLNEVVINQKKKTHKELEIEVKEKMSRKSSTSLSQLKSGGSAIAVRYASPSKEGFWLDGVKLKIKQNLGDTIRLRIRILALSKDGKPGKDLYPIDTIVTSVIKSGWWDVDLKKESIFIDTPHFFVCYELIEDLPTRIEFEKKRQEKTIRMYDLYDRGVKKIQVKTDSINGQLVRTGWISKLTKRETKKYGVDFPTGKTYFSVTPDHQFPTFKRLSSFDTWKPLFNHEFSLVSGIAVTYDPDYTDLQKKAEVKNSHSSYPLVWGSHLVGFRKYFEVDSSRIYKASFYEGGSKVPEGVFRPVQINAWYPTGDHGTPFNLIEYIRTLAWTEKKIPINIEVDQALIKSLTAFGFPEDYASQLSNAQLNANFTQDTYPLIIYTPGLSSEAIENYKLCELLASFGYVVVSIPSLGIVAREMEANVDETRNQLTDIDFAVEWSKNNLPVNNQLGLLGYSWGALSNMVYFFNTEHSIDAMISLDGSVYTQTDLLDEFFDGQKLKGGKSVFIGRKPLDRRTFKYYDRISSDKIYYKVASLQHDNFITLGNDLSLSNSEMVRRAYAEVCALVVQVFNAFLFDSDQTEIHVNPKYISQLD